MANGTFCEARHYVRCVWCLKAGHRHVSPAQLDAASQRRQDVLCSMSFWERHKHNIYKYGHIYATLYGLVVVNYIPQRGGGGAWHRLAVIYSHVVGALLIVVLPAYFVSRWALLFASEDCRLQLQLAVDVGNALLKYISVVVTYCANLANYRAIRAITRTRQQLEDTVGECHSGGWCLTQQPRRQFESMLLFKFALINVMMAVQALQIFYQYWLGGAHAVRVHMAVYAFVMWNYTENMANYFYFINSSALKFYQQLNEQLRQLQHELGCATGAMRRDMRIQRFCQLCDRLDAIAAQHKRLHRMAADGVRIHCFQLLGLVFCTLVSNLTNVFTLFTLLAKYSASRVSPEIALGSLHAFIFFLDTYIVTLVSDNIGREWRHFGQTMRKFNQFAALDVRLELAIERFSTQLLAYNALELTICGLFKLDKRLTFVSAAAVLSYFVTLIQFDFYLNSLTH